MLIDPERLLNRPIPEARRRLARRDAASALSAGIGTDPPDEQRPAHVVRHRAAGMLPAAPAGRG